VVVVKAALAVAAVLTLGGESAGNGLGDPFVFFLAVAPCFVVNALAHLEEEAVLCVRATIIEFGYPTAAAATVTGVLPFAFAPVRWVRVGVVAPLFTEIYNGAGGGYFGFNRGGEEAFGGA